MRDSDFKNIGVVILAAGQGKRMQSDLPKVMHLLNGRPLVDYVVGAVESLGVKPVVVVGNSNTLVQDYLKDRVEYAVQAEQLGTGHAVASAENNLKGKVENVAVFYGDAPFVTSDSMTKLISKHIEENATVTMATFSIPDFSEWRQYFYDFGRVVRDEQGKIIKIIQKKDATEEELKILELDPSYFCFKSDWLWENLKNLKNNNAQGEYYLTDLIKIALDEGVNVVGVEIDLKESIGINTKDHLNMAQNI